MLYASSVVLSVTGLRKTGTHAILMSDIFAEERKRLKIIKKMNKEVTQERLLACIPGKSADRYEDDVEDLLDQLTEADAMHPAAAYTEVAVDHAEDSCIQCSSTNICSSLFALNCHEGDKVYPCLVTVGKEMDAFAAGLDDPMLSYLQGTLMNLCLDDALLTIAEEILKEHPEKKLMMVKPGVAGICELSEQAGILALLENGAEELGVTVSDRGFLTPGYSSTALLFLSETGVDCCADWQEEEERKRLLHELNVMAGHI